MAKITTVYIVTESGELLTGAVSTIAEALSAGRAGWSLDAPGILHDFIHRKGKELANSKEADESIRRAKLFLERIGESK